MYSRPLLTISRYFPGCSSQCQKALRHLDPLVAARPNDWRAYLFRGLAHAELGDAKAGVTDYTRAVELGADDFRCWNNRAIVHFALGNWKEAATDCEKVIADFPDADNGSLALTLIRARARLGDAAGYRRACTKFVDRWGKSSDLNVVAWPCVLAPDALADMDKVVELAEKAYKQSPTPMVRNTLGAALYRAGKWERAVETLEQNQGANGAFDWLFLAMAHHRLGHTEKAMEYLDKATAWIEAAMQNQAKLDSTGRSLDTDQRVELPGLHQEAESLVRMPAWQDQSQ
jgi:tetratricopeptide (TPR) repeat protein